MTSRMHALEDWFWFKISEKRLPRVLKALHKQCGIREFVIRAGSNFSRLEVGVATSPGYPHPLSVLKRNT